MKLVNVLVSRGKMMSVPRVVGEHEVPVLQSVHGENAVHVTGEAGEAPAPDAQDEYERLAQVYGIDRDRNATHVEIVYGRGPAQLAAVLAAQDHKPRKAA